jgi:hypothetical protein
MLDDEAIERYARQVVVPGIGASGQERLMGTTVRIVGHPRGIAQAGLYLAAAGLRVSEEESPSPDLLLIADIDSLPESLLAQAYSLGIPVCWYALTPEGFRSGVHPDSPLPLSASTSTTPPAFRTPPAWHDAAACDAAALACAVAIGLEFRREIVAIGIED